jgi:DNA-binding MarR family transcriptional regulator
LICDALSLILFVHLAFAEDSDKRLASASLNRTHHRILFLVAHKPGVTVGEIVNLLRLTGQAVQPPLRALIDNHLVKQQSSERDRRKRHLTITKNGITFLNSLSSGQFARLSDVRRRVGDDSFEQFLRVMRAMTTESDREWLYPTYMNTRPGDLKMANKESLA